MKTKYFFALALPVALASCSDQLETISNNQPVADGNRRMVKVNINVDGNEQTRLSYQNGTGYVFDGENEAFGACLMDVINWNYPNYANWQDNFSLVDYIQTNYKFAKGSEGTSFSSEATLCEGNYFFYYPYNANNLLREALVLQAPNQIVMDGTKSALDVLKDQKFVGYATVKAEPGKEVASLTVEPKPIFSLAGVRVVNTGTQPKTISKITLERPGKFVKEVVIDPTHDYGWPRFDVNNPNALDAVYVPSGVERYDQAVVTYSPAKILNGSLNGSESTLAYFLALSDDIDNPYYSAGQYTCRVYCEEGLGIADLSADHVDAGTGATNIPNEGNFGAGISYNHLTVAKVTIDDTALGHPNQLDVYSEDELRLLVNWSKEWTSARTLTADLKNDIKLTQKVVDLLAKNNLLTLNVTSSTGKTFTVPAGLTDLDKVNRISVNCNAEIAKGATVSTKDFNFNNGLKVNGTFNVENSMSSSANNYGVVNVKAGNVSAYVNNYAEVNVDAKSYGWIYNYTSKGILNVNNAYIGSVYNDADAKVIVAANGVLNDYTYNIGTIENTGEISGIYNYGTVTIKAATAKYKSNDGANGYVDITVKPNFYSPGDGEKNQATTTLDKIPGYTGTYELAKVVLTDGSVSADKIIKVAEIELPNLATVSGKLTLTGEVKLGAKNITVSKDLTITGNATLATKNAYVLVKSGKTLTVSGTLYGNNATVEAETDGVISLGSQSGVTVKTW